MAAGTPQILRLPGEASRELWLRDPAGVWVIAARDEGAKGGILGIESLALDSSPFWGQASPEAGVSLESTASLRWEGLGLEMEEMAGQAWACWPVAEEEGRTLTGTVALAAEAPQDEWAQHLPDSFEVSARLFPLPPSELVLWKEMGRYVLVFTRGEEVLHIAVLSSRELDQSAADEVRDLAMALDVGGMLPKLKGVRVWTAADSTFTAALKKTFDVRVKLEEKPAPRLPAEASGILPSRVAEIRVERVKRARQVQFLSLAAVIYLGFFTAWAGWLFWRDHQIGQSVAQVNARQPEVEAVRDAQLRWTALEAATEPDVYPVEVFHQVAALLPEEGIRLKEFNLELEKLVVSGEASSVNHALKFIADVKASPALKRFSMEFPQPTVMDDNRASFRGEGLVEGGGDEG